MMNDKRLSINNNFLIADELIKLNELKKQGVLTENEFSIQKQRLLDNSATNSKTTTNSQTDKVVQPDEDVQLETRKEANKFIGKFRLKKVSGDMEDLLLGDNEEIYRFNNENETFEKLDLRYVGIFSSNDDASIWLIKQYSGESGQYSVSNEFLNDMKDLSTRVEKRFGLQDSSNYNELGCSIAIILVTVVLISGMFIYFSHDDDKSTTTTTTTKSTKRELFYSQSLIDQVEKNYNRKYGDCIRTGSKEDCQSAKLKREALYRMKNTYK